MTTLVDVLRSMPFMVEGVSDDGFERIISTIKDAEKVPPSAFRSAVHSTANIRKRLRIVAALLPEQNLESSMWRLCSNKNADFDDFADLLKDRPHEVPISAMRDVVLLLRQGMTALDVADKVGVSVGKVNDVSAFLGTREARLRQINELAWGFAEAEAYMQAWLTMRPHLEAKEARQEYWRLLLGRHRQLTVFEEAAFGFVYADVELADRAGISRSRARKYLASARAAMREVLAA